jgi:osmotically-inducible protein OsmY
LSKEEEAIMRTNIKSLRTMASLGLAIAALGLAGCRTNGYTYTTPQSHADRQLALDVADNLRKAPDTTFPDVAVTAHHGQVLLRGFVATDAQRAEAVQITAQVPGVTGVENDIGLRPYAPVGAATAP